MRLVRSPLLFVPVLLAGVLEPAGAATFTVNTLFDAAVDNDLNPGDGICASSRSSSCSLRAAIQEANALTGTDQINFSVAGTVALGTQGPLPSITDTLFIHGGTAPGYNSAATHIGAAPPRIWIDGSLLPGTTADGLSFTSGVGSGRVDAIGIVGMVDDGIVIAGTATSVDIRNSWIGLRADGSAGGNGGDGVKITSDGNRVGSYVVASGAVVGLGNLISGNGGNGVSLGINADNNHVLGNLIGLNPAGTSARGNGGWGVLCSGSGNRIGQLVGESTVVAPTIAGSALGGIQLFSGSGNVIEASRLGINVNGSPVSSPGDGILVLGTGHTVGGPTSAHGNRIANHAQGIRLGIDAFSASDALVRFNQIGSTTFSQGVSQTGISVERGSGIVLQDNRVLNAGWGGIYVGADDTRVENNQIGYQITIFGAQQHGSGDSGIWARADNVTITGNTVGFSGREPPHIQSAITVFGSRAVVRDNFVGVTAAGHDIGNAGAGVLIGSAAVASNDNLVRFNTIRNNGIDGVLLRSDASSLGNRVELNVIADNDRLAVNLVGEVGRDPSDAGDSDEGINRLMNAPQIVALAADLGATPATLDITYRIDSTTTAAAYPLLVDFHLGRSGSDDMLELLAFDSYPASDAQMNRTLRIDLPSGMQGGWLVAQTQDAAGNSSEASLALPFGMPDAMFRSGFETL